MINNTRMSIVVAVGENREIGKGNKLLWDIPEDRRRFRDITRGHVVIWGRKTFDSVVGYIGKAPPNRTNIVVTRDRNYSPLLMYGANAPRSPRLQLPVAIATGGQVTSFEMTAGRDFIIVSSLEEALRIAKKKEAQEIFIGGGGQIYDQVFSIVDRIYLTIVKGKYDADAYFPDYQEFKKVLSKEERESGGYRYTWLILERL